MNREVPITKKMKGVWEHKIAYTVGDEVVDNGDGKVYRCSVAHTSGSSGTFADDRTTRPNYWKKKASGTVETIRTFVFAILIAVGVRTAAYEPFNIPSGSMIPTLLVGDYLFVSKFSYGYSRYSLPFGLPLIPGRIFAGEPERGDVAVFKRPPANTTDFIKRIVGLPGDRLRVVGGVLHINGKAVERERIDDWAVRDPAGRVRRVPRYLETLPNGRSHPIIEMRGDVGSNDNTREYVVPPGHFFAMGDNRDNSADSRDGWFVPAENFVGRAEFLFFSTDGTARLWEFWKWPSATRFRRLFSAVE